MITVLILGYPCDLAAVLPLSMLARGIKEIRNLNVQDCNCWDKIFLQLL